MGSIRRVLGDRVSGCLAGALTGYLLVLQLFVAAFTCGMTVPVSAAGSDGAPSFVLCEPSRMLAGETAAASDDEAPDDEAGDHGFSHQCPCVICQGSDAAPLAALAPGADLGPAFARFGPAPVAPPETLGAAIDPGRLGLAPAPRGPPAAFA